MKQTSWVVQGYQIEIHDSGSRHFVFFDKA